MVRFQATVLCLAVTVPAAAADFDVRVGSGTVHVSTSGATDDDAAVRRWIDAAARGVSGYLGRPPVPDVDLRIAVGDGQSVRHGVTFGGDRPNIRIRLGRAADDASLRSDWVLTHEMVHLGFPDITTSDAWAEEGLATYVEPWARASVGSVPVESAWSDLMDGLPHAAPDRVTTGLHATRDWGRTYWGGALFWLLADVKIREASRGRLGLPDALRGILDAGGDIRSSWPLTRALEAGDRAIGQDTLVALYRSYGEAPGRVDLRDLWRRLGVSRADGRIAFDDKAPLAAVRQAITRAATPRS